MSWVLVAIVVAVVLVRGVALAFRFREAPPSAKGGRAAADAADVRRSGLVAAAACLALIAGAYAILDETIELRPWSGAGLVVAALLCVLAAVLPLRGRWGERRRRAVALLAALWAVAGLATLPFTTMATACACTSPGAYIPPALLGLEARGWISTAAILGPILLLVAAGGLPSPAAPSKDATARP